MPDRPSEDLLALGDLLVAAGREAMRHFGRPEAVWLKADDSPATSADLAAERVILEGIRARWPDEAVESEESGLLPGGAPCRWLVDPIDGTSAFVEGLAHWGTTAARMREGRLDLGGLFLPRLDELYRVEAGRAWFGADRLGPLGARPVPRVVYLPSGFHRFFGLHWRGKGRNLGGTAAHLALVARGAASATLVGPAWYPWDTAVGLALIEAAGGCSVRLADGAPLDPVRDQGAAFIAGLPEVVAELAEPGRLQPLTPGFDHAGP